MTTRTLHAGRRTVALTAAILLATACTTASGVTGQNAIAQARYALFDAEAGGAEQMAPAEMALARERLVLAEEAVGQSKPLRAARLARESTATARLAIAQAQLAQAMIQAAEAVRVERDAGALLETTEEATGGLQ